MGTEFQFGKYLFFPDSSFCQEDIFEEENAEYLGDVKLTKVGYLLDDNSNVRYHVNMSDADDDSSVMTSELRCCASPSHLTLKFGNKNIIYLCMHQVLMSGDVFAAYRITGKRIVDYLCNKNNVASDDVIFVALFWQKSVYRKNSNMVDIVNPPKCCPICGSDLVMNDRERAMQCVNPDCSRRTIVNIDNYLTLACDIPGHKPIITGLVKNGLIHNPEDLYDTDIQKEMSKAGLQKFTMRINDTIGKVRFINYLHLLPIYERYVILEDVNLTRAKPAMYICPNNITRRYGRNPMEFISLIRNAFESFCLTDSFSNWKDVYSVVENYLSFPMFFHLVENLDWLSEENPFINTTNCLCNEGVFMIGR